MTSALCKVFLSSSNEELKLSAVAALSHMIRLNPNLFQTFSGWLGSNFFFNYLKESDEKSQQALISILCYCFYHNKNYEANFQVLTELLESPGIVIRGKSLLCFMFLLKNNMNYLFQLVNSRFFSIIDRLLKDNYKYVQDCLHHLLEVLSEIIMNILKLALSNNLSFFYELPKLFQSVAPRIKIPFQHFLKSISALLNQNQPELNETILKILESTTSRRKQLKTFSDCAISELLPSIINTLGQSSDSTTVDTQYRFLKIFSDIMIPFLFDEDIYNFPSNTKLSTKNINRILVNNFFPIFSKLLENSELIQGLSINLLYCILERCPQYLSFIKMHGLVRDILQLFTPDVKNLSMNLLVIIQKFVDSEEIPIESLVENSFVGKINVVIRYVLPLNHHVEVVLDLFSKFLIGIPTKIKDKNYSAVYGLMENLTLCTQLLNSSDSLIAEKSAECIMLLLQLFGNNFHNSCTLEQAKALLEVLAYNKSSLQKACLKTLKEVSKNLDVPGLKERIRNVSICDKTGDPGSARSFIKS
jgi:hypothetical protein